MTYPNDPNRNGPNRLDPNDLNRPYVRRVGDRTAWGTGSIIGAAVVAVAIIFGLFYAMNRNDTATATRIDNRPAATTTPAPARETTGSPARETKGSDPTANRPTDSTGSQPAVPGQVPAPASPNR
jgi:hypothetical protein